MAIPATAIGEIRSLGSATGGGWFDPVLGSGHTDYSQQNSPQLTVTDGVTDGTTNLASATGGFTDAMIGNGVYISKSAVWRIIVARVDANNVTLDATVAANTDCTVNVGGASTLTDAFLETVVPGATLYIKADGTHSPGAIGMTADATAPLPWKLIGYNATRGDNPTGTNRPLIDFTTNGFLIAGQYGIWSNIRTTGSSTAGFALGTGLVFRNCQFLNTSTVAGRIAVTSSTSTNSQKFMRCEFVAAYGIGLSGTNSVQLQVSRCMFRDCGQYGIQNTTGANWDVEDCVFDTCGVGIEVTTGAGWQISRCTFYNCIQAIAPTGAATTWTIENCNFCFCGDGAEWEDGTNQLINVIDYNNWYTNTTDVTNVTKGANDTAYDPAFPQHTSLTDVRCNNSTTITSATGFNGRWAVGDCIRIRGTAGNHWQETDATYVVTGVTDAHTLVLDQNPSDGADTGATGSAYVNRSTGNVQDFTLGAASSCRGAGIGLNLGVASASAIEQGAWQAGAGAGTAGRASFKYSDL